jgi:hypothetical protein
MNTGLCVWVPALALRARPGRQERVARIERSEIRGFCRQHRLPRVSLRSTRATCCGRRRASGNPYSRGGGHGSPLARGRRLRQVAPHARPGDAAVAQRQSNRFVSDRLTVRIRPAAPANHQFSPSGGRTDVCFPAKLTFALAGCSATTKTAFGASRQFVPTSLCDDFVAVPARCGRQACSDAEPRT